VRAGTRVGGALLIAGSGWGETTRTGGFVGTGLDIRGRSLRLIAKQPVLGSVRTDPKEEAAHGRVRQILLLAVPGQARKLGGRESF